MDVATQNGNGGNSMVHKCLVSYLFLFLAFNTVLLAQDTDLQSSVDYKVNKMKKVLNLTDGQAYAIGPIIKDYLIKRVAVLQEAAGQGIVDHVAVKNILNGLKESEYQKLSKILNEDQLKKWINKENLMATLNPDNAESADDDGPTLGADGANFKF